MELVADALIQMIAVSCGPNAIDSDYLLDSNSRWHYHSCDADIIAKVHVTFDKRTICISYKSRMAFLDCLIHGFAKQTYLDYFASYKYEQIVINIPEDCFFYHKNKHWKKVDDTLSLSLLNKNVS